MSKSLKLLSLLMILEFYCMSCNADGVMSASQADKIAQFIVSNSNKISELHEWANLIPKTAQQRYF